MVTTVSTLAGSNKASTNRQIVSAHATSTAPFTTDWVRFVGTDIAIALSGTATSVVATVERSPTNPNAAAGGFTSPADAAGFTGDLSAGIAPNIYTEPGVGWWRVNVTTVTGGNCTASMSGVGG